MASKAHRSAQVPGMSAETLQYFTTRKISPETLMRNFIGEQARRLSSKSPRIDTVIVFPIVCNGFVKGHKYRTTDKRHSASGDINVYYGVDNVICQDMIIIVEGMIPQVHPDTATLAQLVYKWAKPSKRRISGGKLNKNCCFMLSSNTHARQAQQAQLGVSCSNDFHK